MNARAPAAGQRWSAENYAHNARFVADLAAPLLDWLAPRAGERVLDLGCGDGALTAKLVAAGAEVVGVDASPDMIAAAAARGLDARVVDAQALSYTAEFDAVFSNAALHWMKRDPDAVVAGVFRALKPGGRFVAELGADGNCASIREALHAVLRRRGFDPLQYDPWYFPTEVAYRNLLEAVGFRVERMQRFARPTPLPGDVSGWLQTFGSAFAAALAKHERDDFLAEVRRELEPALCRDGQWTADYVRLRFLAIK